jgi:hypothetical protein
MNANLGLKAPNILNKQVAMAPKIWTNSPFVALTFEAFCSPVSWSIQLNKDSMGCLTDETAAEKRSSAASAWPIFPVRCSFQ